MPDTSLEHSESVTPDLTPENIPIPDTVYAPDTAAPPPVSAPAPEAPAVAPPEPQAVPIGGTSEAAGAPAEAPAE